MKYRIITQTSAKGDFEAVMFTEDFNAPLEEHKYPQSSKISETIVECDLPPGFPTEHQLVRE